MIAETRTVFWEDGQLCLIDQRKLPETFEIVRYQTYTEVAEAIRDMVVRGAPAIGAAAAFGMALAAQRSTARDRQALGADLAEAAEVLRKARPTAVNLSWAVAQMLAHFERAEQQDVALLKQALLAQAQRIADEDVRINQRIGEHGAALSARTGNHHPSLQHRQLGYSHVGNGPRRDLVGPSARQGGCTCW